MKFGNCSVKYTLASFLTDALMRCAAPLRHRLELLMGRILPSSGSFLWKADRRPPACSCRYDGWKSPMAYGRIRCLMMRSCASVSSFKKRGNTCSRPRHPSGSGAPRGGHLRKYAHTLRMLNVRRDLRICSCSIFQDKVLFVVSARTNKRHHHLRSYFAQKGGARSQGREGTHGKGREHVKWDMYAILGHPLST
jgi:hypothetical protein